MRLVILGTFATILLLGAGCGELDNPTGPLTSGRNQIAPAWRTIQATDDVWNVVCSADVEPGRVTEMSGSRYTLIFQELSLLNSLSVTIRERDPDIVDVELGPDGSVFQKPVTLEVDYRGTEYDPSQPNYRNRQPKLFWFNPGSGDWVVMPGIDDPKRCVYTVNLEHFSRYAMGDGTSGWEDAAGDRDKDSIK